MVSKINFIRFVENSGKKITRISKERSHILAMPESLKHGKMFDNTP